MPARNVRWMVLVLVCTCIVVMGVFVVWCLIFEKSYFESRV